MKMKMKTVGYITLFAALGLLIFFIVKSDIWGSCQKTQHGITVCSMMFIFPR